MRSTWIGLEMGKRSIGAQQYALDITGHNIANANTEGFSRQAPVLETTTPFASPQRYAISPGQFGTGVTMNQISRLRDQFMDLQFRNENQALGYWDIKKDVMDKLEGILNEPTDDSMRSVLDQFWESLENLSQNPEADSARSTVVESGQTLCDTIQNMYRQLKELNQDLNANVKTQVEQVNSISKQIADLNDQIQAISITGNQPNDLMDRRDLLIDQLCKIVDVQVNADKNDMVSLITGGRALVRGIYYSDMKVINDANGMYKVVWGDSENYEVNLVSGSLQGVLESRGENDLYWKLDETTISETIDHFENKILNYQVDTQRLDTTTNQAAYMNKLYEYSEYSGDLIPSAGMTYTLTNPATAAARTDLNGQILLEVISKNPATNELTIRYSVDGVDRTGVNHFTNSGTLVVADWGPGGNMVLQDIATGDPIALNETGSEELLMSITGLANGSSAFNTGDKFVMALTAARTADVAGVSTCDGMVVHNMDTLPGGKNNVLQYYFDEGVMSNTKINVGSFALNEDDGSVYQNNAFGVAFQEITVDNPFRDGTAVLINRKGDTLREVYSQEIVNPYTGVVPTLIDALNTLSKLLLQEMNKVHRSGYNLNNFPYNTNVNFFKDPGEVTANYSWAETIALSDEVLADSKNIAAASRETRDSLGNRINFGDGGNCVSLARIKQTALTTLDDATLDDYWRAQTAEIGVKSQEAARMDANVQNLVDQVDAKRLSVSGVSLDEEMTSMMRFQHAYNAAARYLTTVDESLDKIINGMGRVGL